MRDHAIEAIVEARGRDHDHLALGLGEAAGLLHQRVMIGEEGAELVGTAGEREKDVRARSPTSPAPRAIRSAMSAAGLSSAGGSNRLIGVSLMGAPRVRFGAMLPSRRRGKIGRACLGEGPHGARRLHLRRDPARPATGEPVDLERTFAELLEQIELADRVGLDVFGLGEHHRPGLRDLGAGGGARGGRGAHAAHPAHERGHGALVRRSGAGLSAVRHARLPVGRAGRDHGRARRLHRILPAVRLRPRRLRRRCSPKTSSSCSRSARTARPTGAAAVARRSAARASIRARCRTPCPSGSPRAARRSRSRGRARSACRSRSPSSAASPRASPRSPRSIARRATAGVPDGALKLGINGHGFVADTAEAAAEAYFAPYAEVMSRLGRERGWPPLTRAQFDAGRVAARPSHARLARRGRSRRSSPSTPSSATTAISCR